MTDTDKQKLSPWQVARSVAAAAFGVQHTRNLERDLVHGSPKIFIVAGIIGTALFVAVVALVVKLVLRASGG